MFCCQDLGDAVDRGWFYRGSKQGIEDGRIVNDVDTEYYLRAASTRGYAYVGMNYCPFCGRAISLGLWAAEKKK